MNIIIGGAAKERQEGTMTMGLINSDLFVSIVALSIAILALVYSFFIRSRPRMFVFIAGFSIAMGIAAD
jgi:hypothetical protein